MAESKPIEQEDIIAKGLFNEPIKNAKDYEKSLDKVEKQLLALRDASEEFLKTSKTPKDSESLKKFNTEIAAAEASLKGLNTVEKERIKLAKQFKETTDEEVKCKIRYQQATKAQKDELRDLIVLENKEAGTLEKLTARNRQLRREREKLNIDTKEGKKRLTEINKEIDANNDVI